jgi:hypothetical protein
MRSHLTDFYIRIENERWCQDLLRDGFSGSQFSVA